MSPWVTALRAIASSRLAERVWDRIVDGADPDTITLADLIDRASVNRLRRAAALERARRDRADSH